MVPLKIQSVKRLPVAGSSKTEQTVIVMWQVLILSRSISIAQIVLQVQCEWNQVIRGKTSLQWSKDLPGLVWVQPRHRRTFTNSDPEIFSQAPRLLHRDKMGEFKARVGNFEKPARARFWKHPTARKKNLHASLKATPTKHLKSTVALAIGLPSLVKSSGHVQWWTPNERVNRQAGRPSNCFRAEINDLRASYGLLTATVLSAQRDVHHRPYC